MRTGVLILLCLLASCSGSGERPAPRAPGDEAAVAAVLARADAADGAVDHVVAKCPGCGLGMEGDAQHAAHVGEYDLHFCSAPCRDRFTEDTTASLLAMEIPER